MMTESEFKKLPVAQRKSIQQRLKDQGIYAGEVDGAFGGGTEAALKEEDRRRAEGEAQNRRSEEKARADKLREEELALERERLRQTGGTQDVVNKETERKTKAKEQYAEDASSGLGMAAQSGASLAAPALGTAAGYRLGGLINARINAGQEQRNRVLQGVAEDRVKGLTTREGAVAGANLAGAAPFKNPALRTLSRGAPHIGLGGLSAAKGVELLSDTDEDQPFYPRMADRAAGLGYVGFGGGLLKRGIEQMASPEVTPDARALAIINSSQLRRNGVPGGRNVQDRGQIVDAEVVPDGQKALPAPDADGPRPGTLRDLQVQAKRLGIPYSGRDKSTLADNIATKLKEHGTKRTVAKRAPKASGVLGPLAAAGLAYMATPDDANASTGDSATGQDEALTNAAISGGIAAGTGAALRGMGGVLEPLGAMTIDPLEGATREDSMHNIRVARGQAGEYAPWIARNILGVTPEEQQTYEASKLPSPNPLRSTPMPGNQYYPLASGNASSSSNVPNDDFESALSDIQMFMQQQQGMVSP